MREKWTERNLNSDLFVDASRQIPSPCIMTRAASDQSDKDDATKDVQLLSRRALVSTEAEINDTHWLDRRDHG